MFDENDTDERQIRVGCAGWSVPAEWAERFPAGVSHLQRYSSQFSGVEINSSFYRPHRPATYARWAATTPEGFRFAVKAPREVTHKHRLTEAGMEALDRFLVESGALGVKRGPVLLQLPPSLKFDADVAARFFGLLRERFQGSVVCEPRHPSFFEAEADALLAQFHIGRVAADPAVTPVAARSGGWAGLVYYRWHGSPRMYYSAYPTDTLDALADALRASAERAIETWCIFDNTAAGAATGDALGIQERLSAARDAATYHLRREPPR